MKRDKEITPLSKAIDKLLEVYRMSDSMNEISIEKEWKELMGSAIANKTTKIELRKKILIIHLESAVLRHELNFAKEKLKESLNRKMKKRIIDEIIFS